MPTWPNFLIIGAMKSGTTALYHNLKQHPAVFMSPIKEPDFFSFEGQQRDWGVQDRDAYLALFAEAGDARAIGEASPTYMNAPQAVERIRHYVPHARLIAILRNPVDRAYSHYWMKVKAREGDEMGGFLHAFHADDAKLRDTPLYFNSMMYRGFYHRQLEPYFAAFPREQIRIYLYDDLLTDDSGLFADLYTFLGLPPIEAQDVMWTWQSGKPKSRMLYRLNRGAFLPRDLRQRIKRMLPRKLLLRLRLFVDRQNTAPKPKITPEERAELLAIYRDDITALQTLINRDLSHWLKA